MIKSSATVCLVTRLSSGPWLYWYDLEAACASAAALGFDAVELFTESADEVRADEIRPLFSRHGLSLAAVGTGAGKVIHGLTLSDADPARRRQAVEFVFQMIDAAAESGAPAIVGSMQGNVGKEEEREDVLERLAASLAECGERASERGTFLLIEPLNRYESNLLNRLEDAATLIKDAGLKGVRILADLFHMNIEETSIESALRKHGPLVGHMHFVDTNRRPVGGGHLDAAAVGKALRDGAFSGYASAEAFPWPTSEEGARATIRAFRRYLAP